MIFLWKLSQGLVSGYDINFTPTYNRTGRNVVPTAMSKGPACLRKAKEDCLALKGAALFNCMPIIIRKSDHGDVSMFKNHLDYYLQNVPDQPTIAG